MSDHLERACMLCGSLLHNESNDCRERHRAAPVEIREGATTALHERIRELETLAGEAMHIAAIGVRLAMRGTSKQARGEIGARFGKLKTPMATHLMTAYRDSLTERQRQKREQWRALETQRDALASGLAALREENARLREEIASKK